MRTQLFIEGYPVDLTDEAKMLLTFTIDDVKDFGTRNTDVSKTLKLPGTNNNNKVFGHVYNLSKWVEYSDSAANVNTNFSAAHTANCILFNDGIQAFRGLIKLNSIINTNGYIEYDVAMFGSLRTFIGELLKSETNLLSNIDFSDLNHTYDITNITQSWADYASGSLGSGYLYPLIDYGQVSFDKHDYSVRAFMPALYIKEIYNRIKANGNTTIISDFLDNQINDLIMPFAQKELTQLVDTFFHRKYDGKHIMTSSGFSIGEYVKFPTLVSTQYDFISDGVFSEFTYVGDTNTFDFEAGVFGKYGQDVTSSSPNNNLTFTIQKNGTGIGSPYYTAMTRDTGYTSSTPPPNNYAGFPTATNITLNSGDKIRVYGTVDVSFIGGNYRVDFGLDNPLVPCYLKIKPTTPQQRALSYGGTVDMNQIIPAKMQKKDFFLSLVKMFNLYVWSDIDDDNTLHIEPYNAFFQSVTNARDWTNKMDRSKPITITPMAKLTARILKFKYKNDNDYWNNYYEKKFLRNYGDKQIDNQSEFVNSTQSLEIAFSPTVLHVPTQVGSVVPDKVVSVMYNLRNDVEERTNCNPRILKTSIIIPVNNFKIHNIPDYMKGKELFKGFYDANLNLPHLEPNTNPTKGDLYVCNVTGSYGSLSVRDLDAGTSTNTVTAGDWILWDGVRWVFVPVIYTTTKFMYAGHFDDPYHASIDLNFGTPDELYYNATGVGANIDLYSNYWKPYVNEITDDNSHLLTAYFKLTALDIYNIRNTYVGNVSGMGLLIVIDGVPYRINQIIDYDPLSNDAVKVELLKVINI